MFTYSIFILSVYQAGFIGGRIYRLGGAHLSLVILLETVEVAVLVMVVEKVVEEIPGM